MKIKSASFKVNYVLKEERDLPTEDQTIFVFRSPTLKEKLNLSDGEDMEVIGDPNNKDLSQFKTVIKGGDSIKKKTELVKSCLLSIKNLKDELDKDIEWPAPSDNQADGKIRNQIMSQLFSYIMELSDVLIPAAKITEDEGKN